MANKPHITETPDTSYIKNLDVTHETSDVHIGGIAKFVIGLVVLMVVSFLLMWAMFRGFQRQSVEEPRSPMALSEKDRLPPEPRLQGAPGFAEKLDQTAQAGKEKKEETEHEVKPLSVGPKDPLWEIRVLHEQWNDVLKNGPRDQNGQRYGMPIEQAKAEVLKTLPTKDQKAESKKQ
jgi:hypothetical protein